MPTGTRIPRDIETFNDYITSTDDYQLSIDPVTTNPRWQNWGWKAVDSTAWTDFRTQNDALWLLYKDKVFRRTDDTNNYHVLIGKVVDYDQVNKLLDKISITPVPPATLADFEKFNVLRGTPLADSTPTDSSIVPGQPDIKIAEVKHLTHVLDVTNPAHSGVGKGPGIKDIQVWRALVAGGAPEPDASAYTQAGDAERGKFTSTFTDADKRKDAWYKARMHGTNGKYGEFCTAVMQTVI